MRLSGLILSLALALLPVAADAHPSLFDWWGHCPAEIAPKYFPANYANREIDYTGLVTFCREAPDAVLCTGHPGAELTKAEVTQIDHRLRAEFQYRSDSQLYHMDDKWVDYTICGDCEDYALTLSEMLADNGEGGAHMALSMETVEDGDGHATLLVDTSDAGQLEVSVGDGGEPQPLFKYIRRAGFMVMDGKRHITVEPGYYNNKEQHFLDRITK